MNIRWLDGDLGRTNRVHAQTEPEGGPAQAGAWCTASASYDATYRDYDIDVRSDQPHQTVTATASNGASHSWYGHPLYLFSHEQPNGTGAPTGNGNGIKAFGGTFSLVVNP